MSARHLLLVEDSLELAENLADVAAEAHFDTEVVHSAEQALRALARAPFDVVLSDLRLPNRSGVELVRLLRNRGDAVPVILMTAFATPTDLAAAQSLGVLCILRKPVDCAQLLAELERIAPTAQGLRQTHGKQQD